MVQYHVRFTDLLFVKVLFGGFLKRITNVCNKGHKSLRPKNPLRDLTVLKPKFLNNKFD